MSNDDLVLRSNMERNEVTVRDILGGAINNDTPSIELSKILLCWEPNGIRKRQTDIGAYCFRTREGSGTYQEVNPASLVSHPFIAPLIIGSIKQIDLKAEVGTTTTLGELIAIVANCGEDIDDPKSLLVALNRKLRSEAVSRKRGLPALVASERRAIKILRLGFSESEDRLVSGIRLLRLDGKYRNEQEYLSKEAGIAISKAASDHFRQTAKAIVEEKPLPFKVTILGKKYLVTARHSICKGSSRYTLLDSQGNPPEGSVYNTDLSLRKGLCPNYSSKQRTIEEVRQLRADYYLIQYEKERLATANSDPLAVTRRRLIAEALVSFCVYTYFDTGCNVSTLQGWLYKGKQENPILLTDVVDSSGNIKLQALRGEQGYLLNVEKPRAGNKKIPVVFSSMWVKRHLPVYLRLRVYLEDQGLDIPDTLIFGFRSPDQSKFLADPNPKVFRRLDRNKGHVLHQVMDSVGARSLNSRKTRNFKSASITRSSGVSVGSSLLGHSEETALKHYIGVEEAEAQLQMAGLLNFIASISVLLPSDTNGKRLDQGGACLRPDDTDPMTVQSEDLGAHAPDCRSKTGCWLCPHFAVHADEEDVWKIHSYLYLINEISMCSSDRKGVLKIHDPIIVRLHSLLERIIEAVPDLASATSAIEEKTMKGHLHPDYQEIFSMYEEVGVL